MKVIIADYDEEAIRLFEEQCKQFSYVELSGKFNDSAETLKYVSRHRVEAAFINIELNGMDGLQLGEKLRELNPKIVLVFFIEHTEYILEALRIKADGYMIRPYTMEDLTWTMGNAKLLSRRQKKPAYIRTFGRFDLFINGELVIFSNKKAKELLALCVDNKGGVVTMEEAVDKLWENRLYDEKVKNLYRRAVMDLNKNGAYIENGEIRYYVNGKVSSDYTGMAVDAEGHKYWFDNGTAAKDKQVYSPADDAWYWFDANGTMAVGKDVFIPKSNDDRSEGKWVRYDENGHMVKGEDYANGGWYRFDEITGEMAKGFYSVEDGEDTKLYYYNKDTGIMEHGAVNIDGTEYAFDDVTGVAVDKAWYSVENAPYWYENGVRQGMEGRGKEIYDPISDGWYWLDAVDGGKKAVSKDVYQESYAGAYADREDGTGKWVRYNAEGRMIKGWSEQNGNRYYFDLETGAMAKGTTTIDGTVYTFSWVTGALQ